MAPTAVINDGAVDVIAVNGFDKVGAHTLPGENTFGHHGTGENAGHREGDGGGHRDDGGAQRMLADGFGPGEALGAGGAHIVGAQVVEQEGALGDVVARVRNDEQRYGG